MACKCPKKTHYLHVALSSVNQFSAPLPSSTMIFIAIMTVSFYIGDGFRNNGRFHLLHRHIDALSMSSRSGMKASPSKSPSDIFFCDQCGVEHIKWVGRCTSCKEWNTVKPFKAAKLSSIGLDPRQPRSVPSLNSIKGLVAGSTLPKSTYSPWSGSTVSLIPLENVELNVTTYRLKLFRSVGI